MQSSKRGRAYGETLPGRNVAASVWRAEFNDHIPAVLDCLATTMNSWTDEPDPEAPRIENKKVFDHGLQR